MFLLIEQRRDADLRIRSATQPSFYETPIARTCGFAPHLLRWFAYRVFSRTPQSDPFRG